VGPIAAGEADAVMGSRMLTRGAARRGGMPLYKFVGNKILTRLQNRLLGTKLSEFHSGYRAYSVAALARLPFQFNADGFHFDTEIIIQLLMGGFRLREVPIPTYYGDEICRVDGIRYAADVVRVTAMSRLHLVNLFYDRKFDLQRQGNTFYDLKLDCTSSHTMALEAVAPGSRVLDIGCGPGAFARELKKRGCRVTGMDQHPPAEQQAFEDFQVWDGRPDIAVDLGRFDFVLLLDIIEHLTHPEAFLDDLRAGVAAGQPPPKLVVTSGNVGFCVVRGQLLLGNFNYGKRGILDLTHRRLYTFKTLRRLFEQAGYRVEQIKGVPAPVTKVLGPTRLARFLVSLNELLIRVSKGFFSYQIFLIATPLPTVRTLLAAYTAESKDRAQAVSQGPS
jgi:SAM-dependent methyltransferase